MVNLSLRTLCPFLDGTAGRSQAPHCSSSSRWAPAAQRGSCLPSNGLARCWRGCSHVGFTLARLGKGNSAGLRLNACLSGPGGETGPRRKQPLSRHCRDALSSHEHQQDHRAQPGTTHSPVNCWALLNPEHWCCAGGLSGQWMG